MSAGGPPPGGATPRPPRDWWFWALFGLLGLRIHDNLSGYLAFRPTLLRGLVPEAVFYGYGDYAIRLLHHVVRRGGRVLEIPTVYRFRKGGESKTRFSAYLWTYLASVFRLRLARR